MPCCGTLGPPTTTPCTAGPAGPTWPGRCAQWRTGWTSGPGGPGGRGGTLIGIVSRRDLLSVFLRPDAEIAEEARQVAAPLLGGPPQVTVRVRSGIVTLSGQPERRGLVPVALGLVADIDGVVTVLDKISLPAPAGAN